MKIFFQFLTDNPVLVIVLSSLFIGLSVPSSIKHTKTLIKNGVLKDHDKRIGALLFDTIYSVLSTLLFFSTVLFLGWAAYYLWSVSHKLLEYLQELNPQASAQIIAASLTVIGSVVTVVIGNYFLKRREIKEVDKKERMEIFQKLIFEVSEILKKMDPEHESDLPIKELQKIYQKHLPDMIIWFSSGTVKRLYELFNPEGERQIYIIKAFQDLLNTARNDLGFSGDLSWKHIRLLYVKDTSGEHISNLSDEK